jgi:hypothetical protein
MKILLTFSDCNKSSINLINDLKSKYSGIDYNNTLSGGQRLLFNEVVHSCLNRIQNIYYNQTASPGIVIWDGEI